MQSCLEPTYYLNHDDPGVQEFAESHTRDLKTDKERAVVLFKVVRDKFAYNPYDINLEKQAMRASEILKRTHGYCNEKAIVLAAALRHLGIPARLYFGNVRNHIGTSRLEKLLQTDVLAFHGCVEIELEGKWLKATPAFNAGLCRRLGVEPLEFNGEEDCIFQQFSNDGRRFMEYIEIHGSYDDMPYDRFVQELRKHYGHLVQAEGKHYRFSNLANDDKISTQ